jgi:hypothetical protein
MNTDEKPLPSRAPLFSPEAIVGIGITVAELGILCLLLGWAEHMRSVPTIAWTWLILGAALFVLGGLAALSARSKNGRRPSAAPDDAQSEPEEQLE